MRFSQAEIDACLELVKLALAEDLASPGDLTSNSIIPEETHGRAVFRARSNGVVSGMPVIPLVLLKLDPELAHGLRGPRFSMDWAVEDATPVTSGADLATIAGPMRTILAMERICLNFLQRLSGIATLTRRYVDAVAGLPVHILDTRKTTPGWRLLEKYAVRCGGGHNHRMGLYDGILIKDNHLAALRHETSPIAVAVQSARNHAPSVPVEIEVDNLDQFGVALSLMPDIILLDNMGLGELTEAVARRNAACNETNWVFLEASGGITLANVRDVAETGVDRISIGALTHSAPALDIALDYETDQP
jgi:nicotinate-nucleotide pyrophosphorylase (carboxylating)